MGSKIQALFAQFIKFAGVGIVSFLIDYFLLIIFTEFFDFHYLASTTMSYTASIIFNYLVSMRFVFTHRPDISRSREFGIFVVLSAIGLVLNNFGMIIGVSLLGIDYRITKLLSTMCVTIFNFVSRRMFLDGRAYEIRQLKKAAAAGQHLYDSAIATERRFAEGAAAAEYRLLEYASQSHFANRTGRSSIRPVESFVDYSSASGSWQDQEQFCRELVSVPAHRPLPTEAASQNREVIDSEGRKVISFDIDYDYYDERAFGKAKRVAEPEEDAPFDFKVPNMILDGSDKELE